MDTQQPPLADPAAQAETASPHLQIPTDQELVDHINAFLRRSGMKPTRFGIEAMGEGNLFKSLQGGRSLSLKNANRIRDFIAAWDRDNGPSLPETEAVEAAPPFSSASSPDVPAERQPQWPLREAEPAG
jgi:hypothetical protein